MKKQMAKDGEGGCDMWHISQLFPTFALEGLMEFTKIARQESPTFSGT
jgi:hypothetical protein